MCAKILHFINIYKQKNEHSIVNVRFVPRVDIVPNKGRVTYEKRC